MTTTGSIDEWLAARRGPKQWRPDEAARVLAAWKRSGQTMPAFSRRHGLKSQRLAWWQIRLAAPTNVSRSTQTLIPMTVAAAPKVATVAALSLVVGPSGVRVDVLDPARVPPSWLAAVVDALSTELP